ncbi:hypothetical protein AOXY_G14480 [Acipenser oxyrinchus oxyrinchus]|uniref:Uncharacterized protein n=1 Tax=Acipenser oxyrinchus oxyrinchus TaxID=40147 RepID=A0AAD8G6W1_ACIOX|nr:hypothetical protein AOXY_G14480 [Acipenser oxyrinchus oxyrinchus]
MHSQQVLTLCVAVSLMVLAQAGPLGSEEKWKSLEIPRNRDLFFQTLQAYFNRRGVNMAKVSQPLPIDNLRPLDTSPPLYAVDPLSSAFSEYERQKNSFAAFLRG